MIMQDVGFEDSTCITESSQPYKLNILYIFIRWQEYINHCKLSWNIYYMLFLFQGPIDRYIKTIVKIKYFICNI